MRFPAALLLTLSAGIGVGCGVTDLKRRQAQTDQFLQANDEERKTRLKASRSLNPEEYAALARKMGWVDKPANGLPPPPTIEELEKRVREAGPPP